MILGKSQLILIILVCGLTLGQPAQEIEQSLLISKYYHNIERQFFVVIGVQQNFTSAISSQLRSWSGLNIIQNADQTIKNLIHHSNYQTLNFMISNITASQSDKLQILPSSQITLRQICQSYYLIRPSLMIFAEPKNQYNILSTNQWENELCSPQMIFVAKNNNQQDNDIERYLLMNNYQQLISTVRFTPYVKKNQSFIADSRAFQYHINKPKIYFFNQEKSMFAIYKTLLPPQAFSHEEMHNPTQIYIAEMTDNLLNIPNILVQSTYFGEKKPIFIFNFRIEEDIILIGSNDFSINSFMIEDMAFKNITLSLDNNIYNVYVLINPGNNNTWLKLIDQTGQIILEEASGISKRSDILKECIEVQEKVIVKVRDNVYPHQPLKANIREEIKYHKPEKVATMENQKQVKSAESQLPSQSQPKNEELRPTPNQNEIQKNLPISESPQITAQQSKDIPDTSITEEEKQLYISKWTIFFWIIIVSFIVIGLIMLIKNRVKTKIESKTQNVSKAFSYFQQKIQTFEMEQMEQSQMPGQISVQTEQQIK